MLYLSDPMPPALFEFPETSIAKARCEPTRYAVEGNFTMISRKYSYTKDQNPVEHIQLQEGLDPPAIQ